MIIAGLRLIDSNADKRAVFRYGKRGSYLSDVSSDDDELLMDAENKRRQFLMGKRQFQFGKRQFQFGKRDSPLSRVLRQDAHMPFSYGEE